MEEFEEEFKLLKQNTINKNLMGKIKKIIIGIFVSGLLIAFLIGLKQGCNTTDDFTSFAVANTHRSIKYDTIKIEQDSILSIRIVPSVHFLFLSENRLLSYNLSANKIDTFGLPKHNEVPAQFFNDEFTSTFFEWAGIGGAGLVSFVGLPILIKSIFNTKGSFKTKFFHIAKSVFTSILSYYSGYGVGVSFRRLTHPINVNNIQYLNFIANENNWRNILVEEIWNAEVEHLENIPKIALVSENANYDLLRNTDIAEHVLNIRRSCQTIRNDSLNQYNPEYKHIDKDFIELTALTESLYSKYFKGLY